MKPINYFIGCKNEDEAKIRFRVLSKKLHPDKETGSKENFQDLLEQFSDFKESHETKPKSTFERFTEFLELFKGLYILEKIEDRWAITFTNLVNPDFLKKITLTKWFQDNRFAELNFNQESPTIILSKPYSNIITAALSIYEFIQVSN